MQNAKCRMQNECVAFGDYLNHFPKENTIIIHYTFSIINSLIGTINWNLPFPCAGHQLQKQPGMVLGLTDQRGKDMSVIRVVFMGTVPA